MYKKIIFILLISLNLYSAQNYKEIKFIGLTQISNQVALETVNLQKDSYSNEEINNAIKKFYKFNYFSNISVSNENSILTFSFKEKPFIAKIEMTGYKTREDDLRVLYRSMNVKKGNMYSKEKIQRAKKALLLALEREGYINSVAEVTVTNINDTSVLIKFDVNKGDPITITNITFKGAKALDRDAFSEVIANKETDVYFTWFFGRNDGEMDFEQLAFDSPRIRDLYLQNGYLDAKVTAAFSKVDFNTNTATIEYTIIEGSQYTVNNTIIYLDENILSVEKVYPKLQLEKNDVFNIAFLRKDQEYIKTQVADKGYAYTNVTFDIKPNKDEKTVDLVYNVTPGEKVYINDVIISGNSRTLDRVIRRNVYLAPKDLYSLTDFKDTKNKLNRTGFFESVDIKQERVSSNSMNILVNVTEASTGNITLGGGYGSYDGFLFNISVSDKNILGSGLNLGVDYEHSSKKNNYTLSLSNPAIRDSIYNGSADIHKNETEVTNDDDDIGDKTTLEKGFGFGVGRSLYRNTRVGINYSYNDEDISYEYDTDSNTQYVTSAITPYINFNNTDDYYLPRNGINTGTSLKYAGVGGETEYILSSTYFKYYYSLQALTDYDIIFRYKNSLKYIEDTGNVPDTLTFYLGGPSSVRGYSSYAFDPDDYDDITNFKQYFTNTAELSFPLIPSAKMRWGVFYDYGMIGEDSFSQITKSGTGALISWISPVGPLQFIFAKAIGPEDGDDTSSFEFSLGSKF
ncbi:outer membrane protein assembly factor BamA [Arcobacteraceae bacterium]|nr:outer membrane protein assembly factor BamA [Arcobacteraceae bacterium]